MITLYNTFLEEEYYNDYIGILKKSDPIALRLFLNIHNKIDEVLVDKTFRSSSPEMIVVLIELLGEEVLKMNVCLLFKYATTSGSMDIVKKLLPYVGAFKDDDKSWILMHVASRQQPQMFKYLVEELDYIEVITPTVLKSAIMVKDKEIVDFILFKKPNMSLKRGLIYASSNGYIEMVKQLVGYGASISLAFKYAKSDIKQDLDIYIKMLKEKELLTAQYLDIKEGVKNKGFKV